jgi:dethiobiotin synthetase
MSKNIFITATGTDIGKTYVSALLVKALRSAGHNAGYYKAALSGKLPDGLHDAEYVAKIAGLPETPPVSYIYETPVSPHLASRLEGNPPELAVIQKDFQEVNMCHDYLIAEGSGGIVCPLRYDEKKIFLTDIIKTLGLSVALVAVCGLGTINATVLTVEYLRSQKIPLKGIIFNQYHGGTMEDDNIALLSELTAVPVIAVIKAGEQALNIDAVMPLFA